MGEAICRDGGLSLTLITPGLFSAGYRPGWLDDDLCGAPPGCPGLRLRLCAVAVERWQPHSGWDLASQKPRATRKLMAAGAVYWFEVLDGGTPAALQTLWLNSLSDDPQDRRDGFGLALPAPWKPTCER
jgi:CRISPR-associated protein Cmr3